MFSTRRFVSKLTFIFIILLLAINLMQNFQLNLSKTRIRRDLNEIKNISRIKSNNESEFIFIGGFARSGTTLMRAILDVHPNIKCGPETKVIPPFVKYAKEFFKSNPNLNQDLENAGLKLNIVDLAIVDFITNVMKSRNFNASRLCAKDPDILQHMEYLHSIFPKAKFIYMVRDARGAAYSLMQQYKQPIEFTKFRDHLIGWTFFNQKCYLQCESIGFQYCLTVKYEDLVLNPEKTIKKIIEFLGEKWTNELLNHHNHIGKEIAISKSEWSTHQIIKPINSKSVDAWKTKVNFTRDEIGFIEPVLQNYNYSFTTNTKDYQTESIVKLNNKIVNENKKKYNDMARELSEHYLNFLNLK